MKFKLTLEPEALTDIQSAITWYNSQQEGLGNRFYKEVRKTFSKLRINPFYQARYRNIHCKPLKIFPFMIHFTINKPMKVISVKAVLHTAQSPSNWYMK